MVFYAFFLLLLLSGDTYSLYVRQTSPRDQAQCSETTETIFWHAVNDAALDIPATVTRTCRDYSLLKRQAPPRKRRKMGKSNNIFDAICHRETTGQRLLTTHVVDVQVPINDAAGWTRVVTPRNGTILLWADQATTNEFPAPPREELDVTVVNSSPWPVSIEWLTRLHYYPEHGMLGQGPRLEPRTLEPTPLESNGYQMVQYCYCSGLTPVHEAVSIAVRLLVTAFQNP